MPFSKLGVLAAGSIGIWQFKSHNIHAKTELCSAPICLAGYIPGSCQTLADVYTLSQISCVYLKNVSGWHMNAFGLLLTEVKKYQLCHWLTYMKKTISLFCWCYCSLKHCQISTTAAPLKVCNMHNVSVWRLASMSKNHSLLV